MATPTTSSRTVQVPPERLAGWFDRFAHRHGSLTWSPGPVTVAVAAADGATATCAVPFPPLEAVPGENDGGLLAHASRERRIGVLLVRRGGFAAGIFEGATLVSSKVGARQVQGRSAAGGWSQQRFARRREGQARQAMEAAADVAVRILLPQTRRLDALVVGGDARAVEAVLADVRLKPLLRLVTDERLDVPDPKLKVLQALPPRLRAVSITVTDPPADAPAPQRTAVPIR